MAKPCLLLSTRFMQINGNVGEREGGWGARERERRHRGEKHDKKEALSFSFLPQTLRCHSIHKKNRNNPRGHKSCSVENSRRNWLDLVSWTTRSGTAVTLCQPCLSPRQAILPGCITHFCASQHSSLQTRSELLWAVCSAVLSCCIAVLRCLQELFWPVAELFCPSPSCCTAALTCRRAVLRCLQSCSKLFWSVCRAVRTSSGLLQSCFELFAELFWSVCRAVRTCSEPFAVLFWPVLSCSAVFAELFLAVVICLQSCSDLFWAVLRCLQSCFDLFWTVLRCLPSSSRLLSAQAREAQWAG